MFELIGNIIFYSLNVIVFQTIFSIGPFKQCIEFISDIKSAICKNVVAYVTK